MATRGIVSFGGYIPAKRLSRKLIAEAVSWVNPSLAGLAKHDRAICNWDEDSLTMAVEACRDALKGIDSERVAGLYFASTTMPFADRNNAGVICAALNLDEAAQTMDVTGSLRAGTSGLLAALGGGRAGDDRELTVLAAADHRKAQPASIQELTFGDGAAAVLLGTEGVVAELLGSHSVARDLVDHYRAADREFDYALEERWVREEGYFKIVPEAVEKLFERTGMAAADVQHFVLPGPARVVAKLARSLGFEPGTVRTNLHERCGDTGAAHPLVMLVHALESAKPGERILLLGFGQGVDALLFEVTPAIVQLSPRRGVGGSLAGTSREDNYFRYLSFNGLIPVAWGMRAERNNRTAQSTFYRKRKAVTSFIGAKCSACGTIQFPKTGTCVNPECRQTATQSDFAFADLKGSVKSFTEDWLAYTPNPPLQYGNVRFEGGGNLMMEFTDCQPGGIRVGLPVRMCFRIKDHDESRGFTRYFWKSAPLGANESEGQSGG